MSANETILVVDDRPTNLRGLFEALEREGYQVRVATGGMMALESVRRAPPDLILLDVTMPEMDGYETCSRLKSQPETREIPVIFLTALSDTLDEVLAFQIGAVDYVTKPVRIESVLSRVRTHLTLRALQRNLSRRNAELDAYARTVAHDLKNPLTGLIGAAQLLQAYLNRMEYEEAASYIAIILRAGQRAVRTIDDLLLLSNKSGEQISIEPIEMGEVLEDVLEQLAHSITTYNVTIKLPGEWAVALGYKPWISSVWMNYISNGIKYGGRPPHVELGATQLDNGMIRFWVRDNGPGMTPDQQERLFVEFERLDPDRAPGHGIGLAIVQRVVTRLGGSVGVESAPGAGSCFWFTLPAAQEV